MVRYVHPGEELAVQIKRGLRAADVANTATGTEKARTRDSTIIDLLDEFAVTSSPTVEPSSGWSPVAPPWVAGEYVWKRTTTTYGDGATAVGPALLATGNDGAPGDSGVGVVSVQPLFKAATNHAPSLYGPTVPVEVFRNRHPNPSFEASTATGTIPRGGALADNDPDVVVDGTNVRFDYASNASANSANGVALRSSMWASRGTHSVRVVPRGVSTDTFVPAGGDTGAMRLGMVAGETYTVKVKLRLAAPQTVQSSNSRTIRAFYKVGAAAYASFGSASAPNVAGAHNLSLTFTLPAGTTEAFIRLYNGSSVIGEDVWFDEFCFVNGAYSGPYFDGSYSPDPDMTARWIGTPNNSESVLEGQHPVGFTDVRTISIIHEVGDGTRELRQIPTSTSSNDNYTRLPTLTPELAALVTAQSDTRIEAPLVGSPSSARRISLVLPTTISAPVPNVAGTSHSKVVGSPINSPREVRLYHGGLIGSGDVYWSNIGLYAGDLFDYDTWQTSEPNWVHGLELWRVERITYSDDAIQYTEPTRVTSWDGIADALDNTVIAQEVEYAVGSSETVAPTTGWSATQPTRTPGSFIWMRIRVTYGDQGTSVSAPTLVTGNMGATGATGSAGVSVSSSTMFYWLGATQPAAPTVLTPPAPWSTTEPTYTPGTSSNLYVVVRTVLSSGTFSYSTVSMSASFAAAKSAFGKYTFSASAPVVGDGAGKPVGAMWVRKNGVGEIDGYWEWSGSAWQARPLSQEIIPLIVAGMISAGAIDGMTITGALLRTATAGARMQFDTSGLRGFNASDVETVRLRVNGDGLELTQDADYAKAILGLSANKTFGALISALSQTQNASFSLSAEGNAASLSIGSTAGPGGGSSVVIAADGSQNWVRSDSYRNGTGALSAPYASAAGEVPKQAIAASAATSVTVTFPPSRFTVPPIVTTGLWGAAKDCAVNVDEITSTSCKIWLGSNSTASRTFGAQWQASQMLATAASG